MHSIKLTCIAARCRGMLVERLWLQHEENCNAKELFAAPNLRFPLTKQIFTRQRRLPRITIGKCRAESLQFSPGRQSVPRPSTAQNASDKHVSTLGSFRSNLKYSINNNHFCYVLRSEDPAIKLFGCAEYFQRALRRLLN